MKIIDGKLLADRIKDELKAKVAKFRQDYQRDVCIAVLLVGNNPASQTYVKNKIKSAEYVGMKSLSFTLPEETPQNQAEELVSALAQDGKVDGILVQLPLPRGLDEKKITSLIPPEKDVDGFLPENVGRLVLGEETLTACTPLGVITMLKSENVALSGKRAVVIGRSNIVGKPMALLLLKENATVTVCHSKTADLKEICLQADVLISAIGKPKFVTADMVKDGSVVIDVGINRVDGKLCGDVDFENVKEKVSYISPVPGGVGPMTIATLMQNTYAAALRRENGRVR